VHAQHRGGGASFAVDPTKLKVADYVIAGGTLLFLVLSWFTWFDLGIGEVLGVDIDDTISGWNGSGAVRTAFFLFLLAAIWAALPAVYDVKLAFPRSWITVGLAALGFLLTLLGWFRTFDYDFSIWALLGMLTAAAILVFAVLSMLPELRNRPANAGGLAGATEWANRSAPQHRRQGQPGPSHARGAPGQSPPQQYAPPPAPPGHAPPPTGPPTAGGATSAGQGPEETRGT
jgi:hypothetical protein